MSWLFFWPDGSGLKQSALKEENMTKEELEGFGLTAEQITNVQELNDKEVNAAKQQAETERDGYKEQLDTATSELAKFKDADPAKLNE